MVKITGFNLYTRIFKRNMSFNNNIQIKSRIKKHDSQIKIYEREKEYYKEKILNDEHKARETLIRYFKLLQSDTNKQKVSNN
jgi:hypothetical protein